MKKNRLDSDITPGERSQVMEKTGNIIASIKRATKKHYAAEEKIKIVLEGLSAEFHKLL